MSAEIVIFAFAALVVAAALFVRLRLGTAVRDGRIPDPPPGRIMLFLELAVLLFLCLLIPRPGSGPDPRQGNVGARERRDESPPKPPETGRTCD